MSKIWAALAFGSMVAVTSAQASDDICFERAQTQAQLNECAAAALKAADDELNKVYRSMQDRLKNDPATKTLLIDAQRKWLSFRDSECSFTAVRSAGGSMHAMEVNGCLTDLARTRVIALQNHLACGKNADEQDAMQCALPGAAR